MSESDSNPDPRAGLNPASSEPAASGTSRDTIGEVKWTEGTQFALLLDLVGPDLRSLRRDQYRYFNLALQIGRERAERSGRDDALLRKLYPLWDWMVPVRIGDEVYRHHARELFDRVAGGKPLQSATRAEVLAVLAAASIRAPVSGAEMNLLLSLFWEVWGASGCEYHKFPRAPAWSPEMDEALAVMSQRHAQAWRVLPPEPAADDGGLGQEA